MPKALPLYHPTADELNAAHAVYTEKERIEYAYRIGRHMLTEPAGEFSEAEAIHLLMKLWNPQAPKIPTLTVADVEETVGATAALRAQFADRHIITLDVDERDAVAEIFMA